MKRMKLFWTLTLQLFLFGGVCIGQQQAVPAVSAVPATPALSDVVQTDVLRVQKAPDGAIEELNFKEAVTEHAGTDQEKQCLCQSVCFRVAQLASQAWEDGVFRTYEVERIRTGWNTPGPYEFFSDREMNGEIGDLEMPEAKIAIEKEDGSKANSGKALTLEDDWYEFMLTDGRILQVRVRDEAVFPDGFFENRNRFKQGDVEAKPAFRKSYKQVIDCLNTTPFSGMSVERVPAASVAPES